MHTNKYDLLCIGNYTKDTIITPSGTRYVDGGAMNYSSHAAHQLGLCVAVVTRLAEEDRRVIDRLNDNGIDCYYTFTPSSTTMKLEYPTTNPDFRHLSVKSTAGSITSKDIENINTSSAVVGSSFRGEVGIDVIKTLKEKNTFFAVDMQGFVRVLIEDKLVYEPWPEMTETLGYVEVVKSDAVEAEYLTGEADIYSAAKIISNLGPREIVLTHKDGILLYANGEYYEAKFYSRQQDGRSGRGDTCIGSYMAMRNSLPPQEALIWAAAVTSLKMEKLGPFDLQKSDVLQFIDQKYPQYAR